MGEGHRWPYGVACALLVVLLAGCPSVWAVDLVTERLWGGQGSVVSQSAGRSGPQLVIVPPNHCHAHKYTVPRLTRQQFWLRIPLIETLERFYNAQLPRNMTYAEVHEAWKRKLEGRPWSSRCDQVREKTPWFPFLVEGYLDHQDPTLLNIDLRRSLTTDVLVEGSQYWTLHQQVGNKSLTDVAGASLVATTNTPVANWTDQLLSQARLLREKFEQHGEDLQFYEVQAESCTGTGPRPPEVIQFFPDSNGMWLAEMHTCQVAAEVTVVVYNCLLGEEEGANQVLSPTFTGTPYLFLETSGHYSQSQCKWSHQQIFFLVSAIILALTSFCMLMFFLAVAGRQIYLLVLPNALRNWTYARRAGKEKGGVSDSSSGAKVVGLWQRLGRFRKDLSHSISMVNQGWSCSRPLVIFMMAAAALHIASIVWYPPLKPSNKPVAKWLFSISRHSYGINLPAVSNLLYYLKVTLLSTFYGFLTYLSMLSSFNDPDHDLYTVQVGISTTFIVLLDTLQVLYFVHNALTVQLWKYPVPYGYLFAVNFLDLFLGNVFFFGISYTRKKSQAAKQAASSDEEQQALTGSQQSAFAVTVKRSQSILTRKPKGPVAKVWQFVRNRWFETGTFRYSPWFLAAVTAALQLVIFDFILALVTTSKVDLCIQDPARCVKRVLPPSVSRLVEIMAQDPIGQYNTSSLQNEAELIQLGQGLANLTEVLRAVPGVSDEVMRQMDNLNRVGGDLYIKALQVALPLQRAAQVLERYHVDGLVMRYAKFIGFSVALCISFISLTSVIAAYKRTTLQYKQKLLTRKFIKRLHHHQRQRMAALPGSDSQKMAVAQLGHDMMSIMDNSLSAMGSESAEVTRMDVVRIGAAVSLLGVLMSTMRFQLKVVGTLLTAACSILLQRDFWTVLMWERQYYMYIVIGVTTILISFLVIIMLFGNVIFSDGTRIKRPGGWIAFYSITSLSFLVLGIFLALVRIILLITTTILFTMSKLETSIFSPLFVFMDQSHMCFLANIKMEESLSKLGTAKMQPGAKGRALRNWRKVKKAIFSHGIDKLKAMMHVKPSEQPPGSPESSESFEQVQVIFTEDNPGWEMEQEALNESYLDYAARRRRG